MFRGFLKNAFLLVCMFSLFVALTNNSFAIPLFGKKFDTKCFTCHVTEPMLNDFGRKFQASGFTIAGTKDITPVWNQTLPTFSVLVGPAFEYTTSGGESNLSIADIGFDILTGGSLGDKMNYFGAIVVDPVGDGSYEAAVESFTLFYNNVIGEMNNFNLSFGKMRLFIPSQVNLRLSGTNYLAYEYDPIGELEPTSHFLIGEAQFAVSAFGNLDQILDGARYQVALTNGNKGGSSLNDNQAIFASMSLTKNIGNSPFRIGGMYYGGKQSLGDSSLNNFSRIGVDVDLYDPIANKLNITGQFLIAEDDNVDGEKNKMTGGFVSAVYPLEAEKIFGYVRYDFTKVEETKVDQKQMTFGARYHLAPNVYLFGEYGQLTLTEESTTTEEIISFGVNLAY